MSEKEQGLAGELYCDTRLGGVKRWYIGKPKDADMRIPDSALSTVCFICVRVQTDHGDGVFFIGTGFFFHIPSKVPNKYFRYLVTARHVIEKAKAAGYSEFFIRLNTVDGNSIVAFLPDEWLYPDNPAIDVAVIPINIHDRSVKYADIPAESFATDEVIRDYGIGVGDDLIVVGLFTHRWGHQRNIPIVRSGIIASMPEEPFIDESGNLYDAYLVEMRSIGGLSGSPVFVWLNEWRNYPDVEDFKREYLQWQMRLIGIVRGHWELDGRSSAGDSLEVGLERSEIDRLNTGIAQVTPIKDVLAVINTEKLVKERQEKEREGLKKLQPTLDSGVPPRRPDSENMTQEGFEEALRRASRKLPDEGKEGTK